MMVVEAKVIVSVSVGWGFDISIWECDCREAQHSAAQLSPGIRSLRVHVSLSGPPLAEAPVCTHTHFGCAPSAAHLNFGLTRR